MVLSKPLSAREKLEELFSDFQQAAKRVRENKNALGEASIMCYCFKMAREMRETNDDNILNSLHSQYQGILTDLKRMYGI